MIWTDSVLLMVTGDFKGGTEQLSLGAGWEDLATAFMSNDRRFELREGDLIKPQECGVVEVCEQGEFIPGAPAVSQVTGHRRELG